MLYQAPKVSHGALKVLPETVKLRVKFKERTKTNSLFSLAPYSKVITVIMVITVIIVITHFGEGKKIISNRSTLNYQE